jgi:hypothetical protein
MASLLGQVPGPRSPGQALVICCRTCVLPCTDMGRAYRETTPAMVARMTAALDERIGRALAVDAYLLRERRDSRVVDGGEGR